MDKQLLYGGEQGGFAKTHGAAEQPRLIILRQSAGVGGLIDIRAGGGLFPAADGCKFSEFSHLCSLIVMSIQLHQSAAAVAVAQSAVKLSINGSCNPVHIVS